MFTVCFWVFMLFFFLGGGGGGVMNVCMYVVVFFWGGVMNVCMYVAFIGSVFRSKYVPFPIICSLQFSVNINAVEIDGYSDLLHICMVKPKNKACRTCTRASC